MIVLEFTVVYILIGLLLGFTLDERQMKKHVPYGDFPAIASLKSIRVTCMIICILVGIPLIVVYITKETLNYTKELAKYYKWRIKRRRAIRHLDKLAKKFLVLKEPWDRVKAELEKRDNEQQQR